MGSNRFIGNRNSSSTPFVALVLSWLSLHICACPDDGPKMPHFVPPAPVFFTPNLDRHVHILRPIIIGRIILLVAFG
jgi:hypothetical protein